MKAVLASIRGSRAARIALWAVGTILAVPVAFFLAAAILGLIPANAGWTEAERGTTIFVRSNGVHTWIVMPKVSEAIDWRPYAPPSHLADSRYGRASHVAIGYGNREFYLNTPTWGDLTVSTAFFAAFGNGPTLLHVDHVHDPRPDELQRPIVLRPEEYRRLAEFVRVRFQLDGAGRTIPVLGRGYGPSDMFYEAEGGYSFVLTCNEWTGRALRAAGVRTGLWTPLEQSIMWRLD
ncbi:TIGR02117 family protein [Allosphingosinicella sp.]|jgi:uncharacterized protein (TIGR02117 family)|uniref:TIGR02117 family protein n=1 Tax=Allosphingosinicella sp. TaxID=2823234 RepID=UPI002F0BB7FC